MVLKLERVEAKTNGFPKVRSHDEMYNFSVKNIIDSLVLETKISSELSLEIAEEVINDIGKSGMRFLTGGLIREMAGVALGRRGMEKERIAYTRIGLPMHDITEIIQDPSTKSSNANLLRNPETIAKLIHDEVMENYTLYRMPKRLGDAHLKGDVYIKDRDYFYTRDYCASWDIRQFLILGLAPDGMGGRHSSYASPAKHAEVAVNHAAIWLAAAQSSFSGGQGYFYFNTLLAPYMRGLSKKKIKQCAQQFVFVMTQQYVSRGGQVVFSSIDLTPGIPDILKDVPAVKPGGVIGSETYGEYEQEAQDLFDAFIDVFLQGDGKGKLLNYPKPNLILKEEFMDKKFESSWLKAAELTIKFGTPYFENYLNWRSEIAAGCSSCCSHLWIAEGPEEIEKFKSGNSIGKDELIYIMKNGKHVSMKISDFVNSIFKNATNIISNGETEFIELDDTVDILTLSTNINTGMSEFKRIYAVSRYKTDKKIYQINGKDGSSIIVTEDHSLLNFDKSGNIIQVRPKEMKHILRLFNTPFEEEFKVGDFISTEYIRTGNYQNDIPEGILISLEFCQFLGLYAAEGSLENNGAVNVAGKSDEVQLFVSNFINKINPEIVVEKRESGVRFCNKGLATFVSNLINSGARNKNIPLFILKGTKEMKLAFLGGLISGDGCVSKDGQCYISSSSLNMVGDLTLLLSGIEFYYSTKLNSKVGAISGDIVSKLDNYRISLSKKDLMEIRPFIIISNKGNKIKENVSFSTIPVDYGFIQNRFRDLLSVPKEGQWHRNKNRYLKKECLDELEKRGKALETLTKKLKTNLPIVIKNMKEMEYDDYVYDLSVEDNENFITSNGILCHNTVFGATQMVTPNFGRAAWIARQYGGGEEEFFFKKLEEYLELVRDVFFEKKMAMDAIQSNGNAPFYNQPKPDGSPLLEDNNRMYLIGTIGFNEMCEIMTGEPIHEPKGKRFGLKVIKWLTKQAEKMAKETGLDITVTRTPAESAAGRLAMKDYKAFPGIRRFLKGTPKDPYYTNGTSVDFAANIGLSDRIRTEAMFHPFLSGGALTHIYLGDIGKIEPEAVWKLIQHIAKDTLISYFAFTRDLSFCSSCGETHPVENVDIVDDVIIALCSHCGSSDVEIYSRITGYTQSLASWNSSKKQEFLDRHRYSLGEIKNDC